MVTISDAYCSMLHLAAHIKSDDLTKTMRFCLDRNWTHPPTAASYLTPVVAHSLGMDDHETLAKGCLKWNTNE